VSGTFGKELVEIRHSKCNSRSAKVIIENINM
jgi:hypothetical protein